MTIKELREKRARLAEEAAAILKKAHDDKRELLKADEEETWQKLHTEIDALKRHIDMREKQEALDSSLDEPQARLTESAVLRSERSSGSAMQHLLKGQEDSRRALCLWLLASPRSGYSLTGDDQALLQRMGLNPHSKMLELNLSTKAMRSAYRQDVADWEYRAQAVSSGGAGGFTVPDELMRSLEVALLTYGGMRERSTVIRTNTGASLPFPMMNDTNQTGVRLGENTQVATQDLTFTQLTLDAYKYSSKEVLASVEFIQDSSINVGAVIGAALGTRIGRIQNTEFTLGTGSSQPNGIVTAATTGFTAPNADSQVTTWKYISIVELEHSVDPAYRRNAAFMMADSSIKKTKQILDSTGRPIWAPGIAGTAPDTLLGYPIVVNQDMATMAANAKSVLFGDLSKYIVREVLGVTLLRLEERYADFHQVAFLAFARADGDLLDAGTHPVKLFVNAAS